MRPSLLAVLTFVGCAKPNPLFDLASETSTTSTTTSADPTSGGALPSTETGTETSVGPSSNGEVTGVTATHGGMTEGVGSSSSSSSSGLTSLSSDTTDSTSSSDSSGEPGNQLIIEGLGSFATACVDPDCGAREACQHVTAKDCVWVPYDAQNLNVGSYVSPEYKKKPQEFSFGLYSIINDYGNIASCLELEAAKALLVSYGVGVEHQWCGLGWWYLENG